MTGSVRLQIIWEDWWVNDVLFAYNMLTKTILGRELTQKYIQVLNTVVFQTLYLGYKSLDLDSLGFIFI